MPGRFLKDGPEELDASILIEMIEVMYDRDQHKTLVPDIALDKIQGMDNPIAYMGVVVDHGDRLPAILIEDGSVQVVVYFEPAHGSWYVR